MKKWMPFFLVVLFLVYPSFLGELYGQSNEGGSQPSEDVSLVESGQGGDWTAPVTQAWVRRYNGPGGSNGFDDAYALALDSQGNAYVTGYSPGSGTAYDYATIRYSQQ
jgi:Beta-propeller repeat